MSEQNIFQVIEDILYTQKGTGFLSKKNQFKEAYEIISHHIDLLDKEEMLPQFNKKSVIKTLDIARDIIMTQPLTSEADDFFRKWLYLTYNWNNNVLKDNSIEKDIKYLIRVMDQHYTIVEAINHLIMLNKKTEKLKSWEPPSFSLSKHYLKSFDEEE